MTTEDHVPGRLFPAWGTTVFRLFLGCAGLAIIGLPAALWAWERTPYVSGELDPKVQPVMFDHRHHVRDAGIACTYCHAEVESSATAGIPAVSLCMGCHAQVWRNSQKLAPIRESYFSGAPLEWERVTRLPDYVFFNHAIHVNKGVGCETCHGRVDLMGQVYATQPFTMDFCLDCHRSPERFLRPRERVTDMGWSAGPMQAAIGREQRARLHVQPGVDCTTCHR